MQDHPLLAAASDELVARAKAVKLLLFDVDGVLTDGSHVGTNWLAQRG